MSTTSILLPLHILSLTHFTEAVRGVFTHEAFSMRLSLFRRHMDRYFVVEFLENFLLLLGGVGEAGEQEAETETLAVVFYVPLLSH